MSYCFNPDCLQPNNEAEQDVCYGCGSNLLFKERYRGIKQLGKSQLASTIEVVHIERNKQRQAVKSSRPKVLKILLTDYPKAVELFQQEAQILAQVDCSGIPTIDPDGYFSFQPEWSKHQIHCLVIEKIAGIDLEKWLANRDNQPIKEKQAQEWLKQLLEILEQLHQQHYFHRDIKPANIILQPDGKLALIDFGAARKVSTTYLGKVGVQQGVTSIGTPGYIAPEQIEGAALPQSDFFALGRTLIHLLTGKHPQELPKNIDTGKIMWREQALDVSDAFADLLDLLMAHLPVKRPVNIDAVLNALTKAQKFPHKSLQKSHLKFRLSVTMVLGIILVPLSVLGLFSLRDNVNQQVAANKIADTPLCDNLTCVNRDPIDNKCDDDAQTITSNIGNYKLGQDLMTYRLEVRYSPKCNAVWARTEAPYRSSHYIEDSQGKIYGQVDVIQDGWDRHYADMAPGKNIQVRACAKPPLNEKRCTNFVQL